MRYVVLGNSGTSGYGLASPEDAWPQLLRARLEAATGETTEMVNTRLWPAGARAVEFALAQVEQHEPDGVILSLNPFPCVIPVVSESVRARYGQRAHRLFTRLEAALEGGAASRGAGRAVNSRGRRMAHRLLGARPMASIEEVGGVYAEIVRGLARQERLQVFIEVEAQMSDANRRRHPGIVEGIAALHAIVRPVAEHHRVPWVDTEPRFRQPGTDHLWMPDGVHLSAPGHVVYADVMAAAMVEAVTGAAAG